MAKSLVYLEEIMEFCVDKEQKMKEGKGRFSEEQINGTIEGGKITNYIIWTIIFFSQQNASGKHGAFD